MERIKLYLDEARKAYVVCPSCRKSREMSFSGREIPHASLVKCNCGNTFIITFDKRQSYRKLLDTFGLCFLEAGSTEGIPIRMMDISLGGVQFEKVEGANFHLDQMLRLAFRINEKPVNLIVCVRRIRGQNIGAEIISTDENSKKVMGFYLMP